MEFFELLWGTVLLRPYVFIFLISYLSIAILDMGLKRSLLFTVLAFIIAFAAEYSSTRNGFPFGFYSYIETTRDQELWFSNIPFMDPLSFSFLAYVSYTLSLFLWCPLKQRGWDIRLIQTEAIRHSWRVILTGAVLMMLLDVVIDPVSFLGDRWFLGQIYTYKEQGEYFNIPLTNFGGWFVVGFAILFSYTRIEAWLIRRGFRDMGMRQIPAQALLGPAVYFGVLVFTLGVTFYIGEMVMGLCGLGLALLLLSLPLVKVFQTEGMRESAESPVIGE
ncbi:MAG: carotenoid biosynthesis protein [Nitrospinota bacterium]|nr:carotenoid biosynthesis protein [Nitrospinota bacterium]